MELRGEGREHIATGASPAERAEARRLFSSRDVAIIGVTAYTRFAFLEEQARRENEKRLLAFVELAADLGAPFLRTLISPWGHELDAGVVQRIAEESLNRVAEGMAGFPVKVLVETHDRTSRARDLEPILRQVPSQAIGVLWDMAHSYGRGESLQASLRLIGRRLGYLHVKDMRCNARGQALLCLPGEGDLPLLECRRLLLEWERKWHPELPPIRLAMERLRALLGGGSGCRRCPGLDISFPIWRPPPALGAHLPQTERKRVVRR